MEVSAPIRVYLDSQGFITLSKQPLPKGQAVVLEELIALREAGIAEFGVSLFHVAEVLNPDSEGYENYQRHCGEMIYRLTGGAAFPFLPDLLKGATYPNGGVWIPEMGVDQIKRTVDPESIRKMIVDHLRDRTSLTRTQRRMVAKPEKIVELLKQSRFEVPPIFKIIGIDEAEFCIMLLEPRRARRAFNTKLLIFMADPRHYCQAVSGVLPRDNPVRSILDSGIADVQHKLLAFFRDVQEARKSLEKAESGLRRIRDSYRSHYVPTFGELPNINAKIKDVDAKLKKLRKAEKGVASSMALPLGNERFAYLRTYVEGLCRVDREPSPSEIVDLIHLACHVEVDLLRVDRRMAELIKDELALQGKIVPRLVQLPDAIRAAWKKRQTSTVQ